MTSGVAAREVIVDTSIVRRTFDSSPAPVRTINPGLGLCSKNQNGRRSSR